MNRDREIMNMVKGELDFEIPSSISLHNWKQKGIITGVLDYRQKGQGGGRVGLYHETLPIQIATAAELKMKYTLSEIAEVTKEILPHVVDDDRHIEKAIKKVKENKGWASADDKEKVVDIASKSVAGIKQADTRSEVEKAEKILLDFMKDEKRSILLDEYRIKWGYYKKSYESHKRLKAQ